MVFGTTLKKTNFLLCIIIVEAGGKQFPLQLSICCFSQKSQDPGDCLLTRQSTKCKEKSQVPHQLKALYLNVYVEERPLATKQTCRLSLRKKEIFKSIVFLDRETSHFQ